MDRFDEILKERAREEPFPLPEDYAGRVFQTCAALEETPVKHRRAPRWGLWMAAALALFITVPNASPAAAAALADVPVLGTIVELVTFRSWTYDDGHASADVTVPELDGSAAAREVSDQVRAYTDQLIGQFQTDCEALGEGYKSLDVTSSVVTDSDSWFTLRVDAVETQASGYQFSRFYHIDKATGQVVTLRDLFREDADYVTPLSEEVRRQMEQRMAADESVRYFPEEFSAIDPEQNFYFNGEGELVLVFDEYTAAPGSMGMPEFTIPAEVYGGLLK
ncbi:RsiV family protein [Dysosmobacter sp. Sow4_B12]|uniref:RsiV family protein n=1 Tax=Dysosmobacter sp. Sow4_B12 TaxID=3438777 RepID=UPI003F8FAFCB